MFFLKALSIFLGTVIGVGIFGLPFVALKAGFFTVLLYFLLMAFIAILIHFIYGEIALNTKGTHRLPGYTEKYLGLKWKKATFLIMLIGLVGALLAYLIVAGEFLSSLLSPFLGGNAIIYTLLFFAFGSYFIFKGIKSISQIELILLVILFIIVIIFFIKAAPAIDINNFSIVDFNFLFLPYGIVLFALWGTSVVPEIKEMIVASDLKKEQHRASLRKIILWGTIFVVFLYAFFVFIILGASGVETSKEAIFGLDSIIGGNVIKLGFIFGIIACFTSFLTLGLTLKKMLWYDFGFSKNFSWFITCFTPLIFFLLGMKEFIDIIGFIGAIAIGLEGIVIIYMYKEFLKQKFSKKMNPALYLLFFVFVLGIALETIYFLLILW